MMRRLPTVATAVALAALLATPALARPSDIPTSAGQDRAYEAEGYVQRSYGGERRQRHTVTRTGRRSAAKRTSGRSAQRGTRRHAAQSERQRTPVSRRGVTSYATGGGSRACLTGPTRALLGRIEAQFGRIQIVSTCRPGAVIAGSGRPSKHASGQAIDFNAPSGRKGEVVRWLIANHKSGGVMTYSGMSHIHVDIGPHFVSLNSGRGG
jgi:hypothetical protein